VSTSPRFPTILDRYIVAELVGPFNFGLSAFTLIIAATNILAISRLVSEEHAPLGASVAYFFWQLPEIVVTVMPMAMLLGTLLAMQRLSGDSEITALKAGGIGLVRTVTPVLIVAFCVSLVALILQEGLVPYANDRAVYLREQAIRRVGPYGGGSQTVITGLPGGGEQVTYFRGYDAPTQTLLHVTIITYGADKRPELIVISDQGRFEAPSWTFQNARLYRFEPDGSTDYSQIIDSGQLSPEETRAYQTTYEGKLARPFASFVFALIAIPFGMRPARGGGGAGLGFGLAVAIAFVYFVVASVFSAVFTGLPGGYAVSMIGAWAPNLIFIAIGAGLLRRAARY
jgi:lipopolysaccharide export system permease protein